MNTEYLFEEKDIFVGYFDGLSTYVYEMCHMFGGDSSQAFSVGLTKAMENLMLNQAAVEMGRKRWRELFVRAAVS